MSRELMTEFDPAQADNLIAGPKFPIEHKGVTLAAGQGVVQRGTVLAITADTGQAAAVDSAGSGGAEIPDCVLAETIDTGEDSGGEPVTAIAYSAGYFNRARLIFGGDDTWETHERELRKLNIHTSVSIDDKGAAH